jgi:hypothetical protein
MMNTRDITLCAHTGGRSQVVAISTVNARSSAMAADTCVLYSTVECFVRQGASNPTAVANGTDLHIPANTLLRLSIIPGYQLAFITASGTGTVYLTPEA